MARGGGRSGSRGWLLAAGSMMVLAQAGVAQAGVAQAGVAQAGVAQAGVAQVGVADGDRTAAAATAALAQAPRSYRFDIQPKPLPQAIADFSAVTGLQVLYTEPSTFDHSAPAVRGGFTAEQAIERLLAGSGLSWRYTASGSITVERPARAGAGSLQLAPVTVEAAGETARGPVAGYVAQRSATATKTDTPIIETPQSISVVTRDRMDVQKTENLAEALRYTPSVSAEVFGTDTRGYGLQIRGFSASDEALYLNGLQLKGTGFASFLTLEPYGAERLEVMRGPSSVLYGQNSPGGLINFVGKRPTDVTFGEVEFGLGTRQRHQGQFDIGGPANEDGTILYRFVGLAREGDTQVDHVDHERVYFAPSVTWRPTRDTSLTVLSHYQRDDTGWGIQFLPASGTVLANANGTIPTSRFTGEPGFDRYLLTQYAVGYELEHRLDEVWTVRQNARYSRLENEQEGVFGSGLQADGRTLDRYGDAGESELGGINLDNQLQAKFATGGVRHTGLAGIDVQRYDYSDVGSAYAVSSIDIFNPVYGQPVTSLGTYTDTDITQTQVGLYLQDQIKLTDRWTLVLGGRHDWAETETEDNLSGTTSAQDDTAFTGRAGLVYLSEIGLAPYVSYSESFAPVLGTDAAGKPFEPETGRQYEVGVKYQPPGRDSFIAAAAFDLVRQNTTTTDPSDPSNQVQTGETRARGVELEALASLGSGLDLTFAYAYIDAEITKSNDGNQSNTPYGVPTHRASLWADYTLQEGRLEGLGAGLGLRYVGETWGGDDNSFKVPDYGLVDAAIHYDFQSFRFALNASNLFDEDHVTSCFSSAGCFYGSGREVLATVRYRW